MINENVKVAVSRSWQLSDKCIIHGTQERASAYAQKLNEAMKFGAYKRV
jgi:hypothetical protein